jgi:hypothetical protein
VSMFNGGSTFSEPWAMASSARAVDANIVFTKDTRGCPLNRFGCVFSDMRSVGLLEVALLLLAVLIRVELRGGGTGML